MKGIMDLITTIRYKLDCAVDRLYGLESKFSNAKKFDCEVEMWEADFKIEQEWRAKHPVIDYFISFFHCVVYTIPYKVCSFPKEVRWFIQRGKQGYSDVDIWGFDYYLAKVISGGIKHLRENLHGHPGELTFKQWKRILKQIEEGFELLQNQQGALNKLQLKKVDKSFELLKLWFGHLWD